MAKTYTEKLARLLYRGIIIALIAAVCWYFRSVLIYLIAAAVITLLTHPIFSLLSKIHFGKLRLPEWVASSLSILFVFALAVGFVSAIVPIINSIVRDVSGANVESLGQAISVPLYNFNQWVIRTFPSVGRAFRIENIVLEQLQGLVNMGTFSSVVGSLASFIAKLAIAVFAVIFISFFFVKQPGLVTKIISALIPDKYEDKLHSSLSEIGKLISRYFVGLVSEVLGVALLNFLGLLIIARMGWKYSIGIAFITGIFNVIPYLGPLIGGAIGVALSLVVKYACATSYGLGVGLLPFVAILVAIFVFTQLVDNYFFQPVIYSNSVKAHPLEIFIVFLLAGQIGGMFGMLIAIPSYTVIRVIAKQFYGDRKAIRMLTAQQTE